MDNATPLKKTKKPINKLFLIANAVLLFVVVTIGAYYLATYKPSTTKPKAGVCTPNKLYCRRDDSSVCPSLSTSLAGYICSTSGNEGSCTGFDGCASFVTPNGYCDGTSFQGCNQYNHQDNCFCVNNKISCTSNVGGTSCGYNSPGGENPPEDTPTPTPTTPVSQPTNTPTPTTEIINTPTPTPTTLPGQPTNTPGPTATPIPVPCGTKTCDNNTNPCRSGYICVQAYDGSNYCSSPDFATACKANPSFSSCCTSPGAPTATPTNATIAAASPTRTATVPSVGIFQWGIFGIIGAIIMAGLLL